MHFCSGNDLMTPNVKRMFPGLKTGDYWCIGIAAWIRAHRQGLHVEIKIKSCHEKVNKTYADRI